MIPLRPWLALTGLCALPSLAGCAVEPPQRAAANCGMVGALSGDTVEGDTIRACALPTERQIALACAAGDSAAARRTGQAPEKAAYQARGARCSFAGRERGEARCSFRLARVPVSQLETAGLAPQWTRVRQQFVHRFKSAEDQGSLSYWTGWDTDSPCGVPAMTNARGSNPSGAN